MAVANTRTLSVSKTENAWPRGVNGNTVAKALVVIVGSARCAFSQTEQATRQRLPCGVTVTQRPLEALFMVRIHAGQPTQILSNSRVVSNMRMKSELLR